MADKMLVPVADRCWCVMSEDCFMLEHTHNNRDSHGWMEMHKVCIFMEAQ